MRLALNNIAYTSKKRKVIVHLLSRDERGEFRQIDIEHRPYCYMSEEDAKKVSRPVACTQVEQGDFYTYLDNKKLVKLYFRRPMDVDRFRERMKKGDIVTYEADIPFVRRFMIDRKIKCGIEANKDSITPIEEDINSNLRIMILDIEVACPPHLDVTALLRWTKHPIVVISYWDSKEPNIIRVLSSNKEKKLLKRFIKLFREVNPDLVIGYNIERFDIPYIMRRCQALKIPVSSFSPLNRTRWDDRKEVWVIKGRSILDYARAYRDYVGRELRTSWYEALDYLADKYLGIRKVRINDFKKTWEEAPDILRYRAMLDVAILVGLEYGVKSINWSGFRLIHLFDTIRKTIGCLFDDIFFKSILADIAALRYLDCKSILPNKSRRETEEVGYVGAYIVEPASGIYEDVIVLDFGEFYPRLILLYNISPETLVTKEKQDIGGKYSFSTSKTGILPSIIRKYLSLKLDIKKELKQAKQTRDTGLIEEYRIRHEAIKRLINSFYGATAYSSRFASKEVAEAISLAGRQELQGVIRYLDSIEAKVLYADTDSTFIKIPKEHNVSSITSRIKTYLPKGLEMDLKAIFSRIVFLTKKRYIGKTQEGEIIKKGIQTVRSDIEDYLSSIQDSLLLMILDNRSKDDIQEYLKDAYIKLREGRIGYKDLAKPVQLKKRPGDYKVQSYHVQGIKYSEEYLKRKFYAGMKPRILRIKETPEGYPNTRWLAINTDTILPRGFKLDYKHYLKRLKQILKDILPLVDIDFKDIITGDLDYFLKKKGNSSHNN